MAQRAQRDSATDPAMDPATWRGLTSRRVSRRGLLRAGSLAAGAAALGGGAGLTGLLAGCGTAAPAAAVSEAVGSTAWWRKQRLHHTVNFANWPDYIDVLNGKHPTLEHFTALTGISVNYTQPVSDNVPTGSKPAGLAFSADGTRLYVANSGDGTVSVISVEIRDIGVPPALQDAMSRQAQAEREKQARVILGSAEEEVAQKFVNAARLYAQSPEALQLRAMNIIYETTKERGATILMPTSMVDAMNPGAAAFALNMARNDATKPAPAPAPSVPSAG